MHVLINLKTYPCDPIEVATAATAIADEYSIEIGIAPQAASIAVVSEIDAQTWGQHVSPVDHGSHTGSTLAEAVAEAGATGTLVNHSEKRLRLADIDGALEAASRAELETVVCANNPDQIAAVAALGPDAVAVEPPELIGTGTPVSQAGPEIVEDAVAAAAAVDESIDVYCGAGISTGEDVIEARMLGADGVLLASGVLSRRSAGSTQESCRPAVTNTDGIEPPAPLAGRESNWWPEGENALCGFGSFRSLASDAPNHGPVPFFLDMRLQWPETKLDGSPPLCLGLVSDHT